MVTEGGWNCMNQTENMGRNREQNEAQYNKQITRAVEKSKIKQNKRRWNRMGQKN